MDDDDATGGMDGEIFFASIPRASRRSRSILTLRAFCLTMTTYLCTNPLATSARAVLSSSVAPSVLEPSKVTASIAAARGVTAGRCCWRRFRRVVPALSAAPLTAAFARIVKACIASQSRASGVAPRSDGARPASETVFCG